jgi:hypothetical protein
MTLCTALSHVQNTSLFKLHQIWSMIWYDMIWWVMMVGRGGMMCLWCIRSSSSSDNIYAHTQLVLSFLVGAQNFFVAKNNRRHYWWLSPVVTDAIWVTCTLSCTHTSRAFQACWIWVRNQLQKFLSHTHTHTHTSRAFHAWIWVRTQLEKFLSVVGKALWVKGYHTQAEHSKYAYGWRTSLWNSFQW